METGELVQWNDERGFGFVLSADRSRYFVHISDIGRIATRPRVGDQLRFEPRRGKDGRSVAKSVVILGANPVRSPSRSAPPARLVADWRYFAAMLMIAVIASGWWSGVVPESFAIGYAIVGCLSMLAYTADKHFAETGQWRISEATLHGVDLCGGIVGALLAQAILRHKTRKASFQAATILILGVHVALLGSVVAGLWHLTNFWP